MVKRVALLSSRQHNCAPAGGGAGGGGGGGGVGGVRATIDPAKVGALVLVIVLVVTALAFKAHEGMQQTVFGHQYRFGKHVRDVRRGLVGAGSWTLLLMQPLLMVAQASFTAVDFLFDLLFGSCAAPPPGFPRPRSVRHIAVHCRRRANANFSRLRPCPAPATQCSKRTALVRWSSLWRAWCASSLTSARTPPSCTRGCGCTRLRASRRRSPRPLAALLSVWARQTRSRPNFGLTLFTCSGPFARDPGASRHSTPLLTSLPATTPTSLRRP